jgi:N-acetylmuramoyl-L-alanine amidase-like protein
VLSAFLSLSPLDLRAKLPHRDPPLPSLDGVEWITLHYSGVDYPDRSHAGELRTLSNEAQYHIDKNWAAPGQPPAHGDGLMYSVVVFGDGTVVWARDFIQRWHAGNIISQRKSLAVHLMLGPKQTPTDIQWQRTCEVFAALQADYHLPRSHVVGHCEWPRHDGLARPRPDYVLLPGQSECPGRIIHGLLAEWRSQMPDELWSRWGTRFPLPAEQRSWGIPQFWRDHIIYLGEARSGELWSPDGLRAIQWFQLGAVVYEKGPARAYLYRAAAGVS